MRQGLQGLAQAHVVAKDAAGAHLAQRLQPVQALLLIRAQGGVQPCRRLDLQVAGVTQLSSQVAHVCAAFPMQRQVFEVVQAGRVGTLEAQRRAGGVLVQVQFAERAHDCLDPAVGQRDAQCGAIQAATVEVDQQVFVVAAPGQFAGAQ
ncbi:hypothetical protein D3C76_1061710 [compost metagenome]